MSTTDGEDSDWSNEKETSVLVFEALLALTTRAPTTELRPLRAEDIDMTHGKISERRRRDEEFRGQRYLNSVITSRLL